MPNAKARFACAALIVANLLLAGCMLFDRAAKPLPRLIADDSVAGDVEMLAQAT